MIYAHVTNGVVDAVGVPPNLAYDGTRWWDLRDRDITMLNAVKWYVVAETTKPADTATITWDAAYTLNGTTVDQTWTQRNKTAAEITAATEAANRASIETALSDSLAALQLIIDDTNANINSNAAQRIKDMARVNRRIIRLLINRLDGTA